MGEKAAELIKLKHFQKFKDTTEALAAATAGVEGKMSKTLKKTLKKLVAADMLDTLAVADAKLGVSIKEKMEMNCVTSSAVQELMRCIRGQMNSLITGLPQKELSAMALGLAHSLSRYKLKFSPDKVDTMIVQAISLLDDLDKELNNYVMRCREWYGWHFPELGKIVQDNMAYAKVVKLMGDRTKAADTDFSAILPEEIEAELKEAAEVSMGTEVSKNDISNIGDLCDQILEINDYRGQLYDYLKNRMMAIAPNLTILVGELVGARLIAHAGSLLNLAKHPSSTVQILGAEKALFKALKTKHDTPKYGLIYHAQLVGQSGTKLKGKVSRMLAAKASLACRVDALGEETNTDLGIEHRAKVESRIRQLEGGEVTKISATAKQSAKFDKYESKSEVLEYKAAADVTLKRKADEDEEEKLDVKRIKVDDVEAEGSKKKKKKKDKQKEEETEVPTEEVAEVASPEKKKEKKKDKETAEVADSTLDTSAMDTSVAESGEKKKKKKKKKDGEGD